MARLKHYTLALASGYLLLGSNIAYGLVMVPMALAYLGKPSFGMWAIVVQVGAFLELTDLGMTGAFSRIIIEYKSRPDRGEYASLVKTMGLVFCLQGMVIALLGWVGAPWIARGFRIDPGQEALFIAFLRTYLTLYGAALPLRIFPQMLYAHLRSDLINLAMLAGLVTGFGVLWAGLRAGFGLWAMAMAFGASTLVVFALNLTNALRQGVMPPGLLGARWSGSRFREVFDYGKDRFLVAAGFSVLQSAPTLLVTRFLGLEAGAVWTVGTRLHSLCVQLVSRISDLAQPALAEMYVGGELTRLRERLSGLLEVSLLVAALLGTGLAFLNADFVREWTGGSVEWDRRLDPLLGLWLLVIVLQRSLWLPVGASRQLGFMRFVYFIEALMMLGFSTVLIPWTRSPVGILIGIVAASMLASVPFSLRRGAQILRTSAGSLLAKPMAGFLIVMPLLAATAWGLERSTHIGGWNGLVVRGVALLLVAGVLTLLIPRFRLLVRDAIHKFLPRN